MKNAMKKGFQLWKSHLADSLAYILSVSAVMLMPLVPLLALISKTGWIRWVAVLGLPLFILLVLPMRRNAAQVLRNVCLNDGPMNDAALISTRDYGAKLKGALKLTLLLLLWAAPAIAVTGWAVYMYKGGADAITIAMSISKMGNNDVVRGMVYVLLIYLATWLPLAVGSMLHSGARHAFASGNKDLIKGRRGGLCAVWFCSLIIAIPFLIGLVVILKTQLGPVIQMIKYFQFKGLGAKLLPLGLWLLADFIVLLLPFVPLRHLMIAAYCHGGEQA